MRSFWYPQAHLGPINLTQDELTALRTIAWNDDHDTPLFAYVHDNENSRLVGLGLVETAEKVSDNNWRVHITVAGRVYLDEHPE